MEFDKSKVCTAFNTEDVKIGSKGYFADSKETLIHIVNTENKHYYGTLDEVRHNSELAFSTNRCVYRYFYLVEEPKEKTKRPCTMEELIEILKKQGLPMLRYKDDYVVTVTYMRDNRVHTSFYDYSFEELCEMFTLLDGTELWVEE